jgi:uroporphyrinogen decarboxylase
VRYLLDPFLGTIKGMTSSSVASNTASNAPSHGGALADSHPLMDGRTADSPLITAYRGGKP